MYITFEYLRVEIIQREQYIMYYSVNIISYLDDMNWLSSFIHLTSKNYIRCNCLPLEKHEIG